MDVTHASQAACSSWPVWTQPAYLQARLHVVANHSGTMHAPLLDHY